MNQKVMLLLGLVVPFAIAGCNTNPVAVPKSEDTPLLFEQEAISQSSKVDLLWMIDDSGSMAEEQTAIVAQLPGLVDALSLIDFRLAVTSTDKSDWSETKNCEGGTCKQGQFRNRAAISLSSAGVYTVDKIQGIFYSVYENCMVPTEDVSAWKTKFDAVVGDQVNRGHLNAELASGISARVAAVVDKFKTVIPPEDKFRTIGPILAFANYDKVAGQNELSTSGKEQLRKDLTCLSLVGTNGYGVEQGLAAVVAAVDKNGPNQKHPLILPERKDAKLALLLVSDENDCSTTTIQHWNGSNESRTIALTCAAAYCNLFNTYGYDDEKNPLVSPKKLAKDFLKNLRDAKEFDSYSSDLVYAFAVTGTALPQPGQTSGGYSKKAADAVSAVTSGGKFREVSCDANGSCTITNKTIAPGGKDPISKKNFSPSIIDRWRFAWMINGHNDATNESLVCKSGANAKMLPDSEIQLEMTACESSLGTSVSGDRYYRFIEQFKNRYPSNSGEVGAMCYSDFSAVFTAVTNFVSGDSGDCIQRELLPCEEGATPGSSCGPEGSGGVCVEYKQGSNTEQFKGLFCSAAVEPLLSCRDESALAPFQSTLCQSSSGSGSSCVLKPASYTLGQACSGGVGVKFGFVDKSNKQKVDAAGCSVKLNFTAFVDDSSAQ